MYTGYIISQPHIFYCLIITNLVKHLIVSSDIYLLYIYTLIQWLILSTRRYNFSNVGYLQVTSEQKP